MTLLRHGAIALVVLVLAGGPAAAACSCCCVRKAEPAAPSCCAKKHAAATLTARHCNVISADAIHRGCDCIKAAAPAPFSKVSELRRAPNDELPVALTAFPVVPAYGSLPAIRFQALAPGLSRPDHPPLSILYCTWSK